LTKFVCRAGNKGWAYTFITTEQGRYAGEITRALELSGVEIPPELVELWNEYKTQQESEGKKVKSGGGFSGKGYKFDDTEAQLATEMRKFQKHALGEQYYFSNILRSITIAIRRIYLFLLFQGYKIRMMMILKVILSSK